MVHSLEGKVEVVFIFGASNNNFYEAQRLIQERSNLTKDY